MARIEFGVWDQMQTYETLRAPSAAEVYEAHIRQAQLRLAALPAAGEGEAGAAFAQGPERRRVHQGAASAVGASP